MTQNRPFSDLRPTGLLWLINATVFHPRGYAFALNFNDEGELDSWSLLGNGKEPFSFDANKDHWPEGESPDDAMKAVKELMP